MYYYNDGKECDFIVRSNGSVTEALQVTVSLKDSMTKDREEAGLLAAMDAFELKEGTIITLDEMEEKTLPDGRQIHVIPFYRWCL